MHFQWASDDRWNHSARVTCYKMTALLIIRISKLDVLSFQRKHKQKMHIYLWWPWRDTQDLNIC